MCGKVGEGQASGWVGWLVDGRVLCPARRRPVHGGSNLGAAAM